MKALFVTTIAILLLLGPAACGDEKSDPGITFFDSAVPDAVSPPDAAVCTTTTCGNECVDTATDSRHCGGCDIACASPGQICSGTVPCECPANFLPATVGGGGFDSVQQQGNAYFALSPVIGGKLNILAVVYDLNLEIGVVYDFEDSVSALSPPAVASGYDVDVNAMTAKTPYGAFAGTIVFDSLCATGVSGTLTQPVFSEVVGIVNPTPVEGGCEQTYESIAFAIGTCPDETGDAGVGNSDAGIADAGVADAMPSR